MALRPFEIVPFELANFLPVIREKSISIPYQTNYIVRTTLDLETPECIAVLLLSFCRNKLSGWATLSHAAVSCIWYLGTMSGLRDRAVSPSLTPPSGMFDG